MDTKIFSSRHKDKDLENAREWCKKNMSTLQIQVKEFVRRLSNEQIILKGDDMYGNN